MWDVSIPSFLGALAAGATLMGIIWKYLARPALSKLVKAANKDLAKEISGLQQSVKQAQGALEQAITDAHTATREAVMQAQGTLEQAIADAHTATGETVKQAQGTLKQAITGAHTATREGVKQAQGTLEQAITNAHTAAGQAVTKAKKDIKADLAAIRVHVN